MSGERHAAGAGNLPANVLLVEDNPVIAMNTEALLGDLGIAHVGVAGTVAEAFALLARTTFHFAILDLRLGDQEDSLPIAVRLIEAGVPIVFATGMGEDAGLPARFGQVPILRKPYRFEDLEGVVRGAPKGGY
jgi:CheY-like chemotaxis protein